jgi:nitrate/nitrite transporter NarK
LRVISIGHERSPRQLLFLVLVSEATGGGRFALTLKNTSDAYPKAASESWRLF